LFIDPILLFASPKVTLSTPQTWQQTGKAAVIGITGVVLLRKRPV